MFRKALLLTLLITLLLAGCGPDSNPTAEAVTLTDGLGRSVVMSGAAQRVVSLAPSNTEILFALGAGDQVVGRDTLSDYPEAARAVTVTDIGDTYGDLNTELIVSLKPDLVIAAEINTPEQVKALEDLGLTVYYLKNPTTLEELYANIETVAQLTGQDPTKLTDSLKARVAAVDEKIAPLSSRPSVFYELDGTDPAKPYTAGGGTFITLLLERAGASNIAADIEGYPQLSLEQVVAADPSFIILGDSAYGVTPESIAARPGWENLSAVKNNQIFPFDDNLVSRPGPRLVDGLEALAKLLRPELFQ
jgi:iron complex transport system substrate-binding protein